MTNCLSVTYVTHPFLSVDLHPHTQCLSNPPCFFPPPFALFPSVCLSIPQTDSSDSDLELSTVRHQPEGLDQLQVQTKFTRKELQSLYRGFKNVCLSVCRLLTVLDSWCRKDLLSNIVIFPSSLEQECPSGMVDEETFKTIYSQFFPQGGQRLFQVWIFYFSLSFSDLTFQHCSKSKIKKSAFSFFVVGTENILLSARRTTLSVGLFFG